MKKLFIFDFDGVIVNSINIQQEAFFRCLSKTDLRNCNSLFEQFVLFSGDSTERIFHRLGIPLYCISDFHKYIEEHNNELIIYHDVLDTIVRLKLNYHKVALFTGRNRKSIFDALRSIQAKALFDVIIASDDVKTPKPSSEGIDLIRNIFNISASNSLMIGDSKNDILAANHAGINSIAINWIDKDNSSLLEENPTYIVNTVKELNESIDIFIENNL